MIRPNVIAIPTCVTAPLVTSLITIDPVPAKTKANVPKTSAKNAFFTYSNPSGRASMNARISSLTLL